MKRRRRVPLSRTLSACVEPHNSKERAEVVLHAAGVREEAATAAARSSVGLGRFSSRAGSAGSAPDRDSLLGVQFQPTWEPRPFHPLHKIQIPVLCYGSGVGAILRRTARA